MCSNTLHKAFVTNRHVLLHTKLKLHQSANFIKFIWLTIHSVTLRTLQDDYNSHGDLQTHSVTYKNKPTPWGQFHKTSGAYKTVIYIN
jgi:hypothetical protein